MQLLITWHRVTCMQLMADCTRKRWCEHCCEALSYPVYKKHKELFYDSNTKTWIKNVSTSDMDRLDAEDDEVILAAINTGMFKVIYSDGVFLYMLKYPTMMII